MLVQEKRDPLVRRLPIRMGIGVEDATDIRRAAEVFLEEKTPQQVSYAFKAIENKNSKTATCH